MITVVDYGLGNIKSVSRALAKIGADVRVSAAPSDINNSDGIVVPGVGAFARAMENIENLGLTECLSDYLKSGKPREWQKWQRRDPSGRHQQSSDYYRSPT